MALDLSRRDRKKRPSLRNDFSVIYEGLRNHVLFFCVGDGCRFHGGSAPQQQARLVPIPFGPLFTLKNFCKIEIAEFSFVFNKYCSIID